MKYSFITQKKKTYPVGLMCRLLGVSRSAYYDYEQRRCNCPDDLHHRQLTWFNKLDSPVKRK
ncbi:conserved hypothetical protein [Nitrosomonas eutropha C91]|uniref:Transposase n=1 Tax=Nitrosomonas eutropha (strain DSM 101675 / C91 / Nm57) TaxID=335283 RepID=Q0AJ32_NITEC|nr:conserved hypothetical protein [Nitrosomonas eutropha C91]